MASLLAEVLRNKEIGADASYGHEAKRSSFTVKHVHSCQQSSKAPSHVKE